jgi:hypothetical protein
MITSSTALPGTAWRRTSSLMTPGRQVRRGKLGQASSESSEGGPKSLDQENVFHGFTSYWKGDCAPLFSKARTIIKKRLKTAMYRAKRKILENILIQL